MTKAKLALVGLGTWAETGHLPVYNGRLLKDKIELCGLCSRDLKKAKTFAAEFNAKNAFDDFDTMLKETKPNIVSICTPDNLHTDYVLKALASGCDVLVEKPMAANLDDCKKIIAAAQKHGKKVITLYHKRADSLWAEAALRVKSGVYGKLQMGQATIQNPVFVPTGDYFKSDFVKNSNPNWFLGTHFYDLIRFITGLNPIEVSAKAYQSKLPQQKTATNTAYKADFVMENGASISFLLSWNLPSSPSLTKQGMTLHFENGELELDGTKRGFIEHSEAGYKYANPYFMRETPNGLAGYGANFLEEAVLYLTENHPSSYALPTLEDAYMATAMAEAVEESARTGKVVRAERI